MVPHGQQLDLASHSQDAYKRNVMLTKVYSAALHGAEAREVEIEVNEGSGDPKVVIVGLPDAAVKESKDRVTTAMANSGYRWPRGRTTINLAPADIKKEGPSFDLPIALGMLAIVHGRDMPRLADCCITGELALTGAIRPVKGVLPIALEARRRGKPVLIVPEENAAEASVVQGLSVHGVRNLRECFEFLDGQRKIPATVSDLDTVFHRNQQSEVDFADVKGQAGVKRAFEVAVAGGHNLLMLCLINPTTRQTVQLSDKVLGLWDIRISHEDGKGNLAKVGINWI